MPAKKIVAMFALAAQAQDAAPVVPGEVGERIFSDSLNGVSVENFLDAMTTDYESSYIYEEVVPDNNEYDLFSYDGTDGNDAGRPNGSDDYDGKELDASQLFGNDPNNTNQSAHIGKNTTGHNECRQCSGVDFAACQSAGFETCNDAQDSCLVQIRSEFQGTSIVHKVYSGCSARQACQAQASKNFLDNFPDVNTSRNQCKGSGLHRRFYTPSKCVFCTKLGKSSEPDTILFGSGTTNLYVSGSSNPTWASILVDPYTTFSTDVFAANDWYTTQGK